MPGGVPRTCTGAARCFSLLPLLALTLLGSGCEPGEEWESFERAAVSGEVFLDGKPLKAAAILFESCEREGQGAVLAHGFVEQGRYHIDAVQGPVVGRCRVSFMPKPLDRQEYEARLDEAAKQRRAAAPTVVSIPEKYREASTLEVEIVRGKENQVDFQLESGP